MPRPGRPLRDFPVHLGLGASALPQPEFAGGLAWYEAYSARTEADGREGRLVALHDFASDWTSWEMHPEGDELVVCLAGAISVIQEAPDGSRDTVRLTPGEYAINGPGVWHTADIEGTATVLFVTAGVGTSHRPR